MRHTGTAATRAAVVPADEDATGLLGDLSPWLGRTGRIVTSPARRCRQSCGERQAVREPLLRPWDLGSWTGRPLAELDLAAWRADPAYDVHGGESLLALVDRVRQFLGQRHERQDRVVAVTHAAVIKAAVVQALGAPPTACWDIDVHPGSATELHAASNGWRVVRVNASLDA